MKRRALGSFYYCSLTKQKTIGTNFKTMTILPNIKIFLYCKDSQTPAEFALRGCGVFFCEDIQNLAGLSPGQQAFGKTS